MMMMKKKKKKKKIAFNVKKSQKNSDLPHKEM